MWSLYAFIWENALKGFLREIKLLGGDFEAGRMFFGRPYWNLGAVKQCLAKMPGFVGANSIPTSASRSSTTVTASAHR